MRTWTAPGLCIFFFLLSIPGGARAAAPPYLFISEFETVASTAPGIISLRGVVENECNTNFGPGTYLQVSSDGHDIDIPVGGLQAGGVLRFAHTVQAPVVRKIPATLTFELIVPGSPAHDTPEHYVSPCTPTLVKP